jgi:low affinity Fe/Cu permease
MRQQGRLMSRRKSARPAKKEPKSETCAAAMSHQGWFSKIACDIAHLAGKPAAFLLAATAVVLWAISGPLFGFSDTWQLVINTSTTIVTFLMVFLIQNTQNRDTTALQVKLDELIFGAEGASNEIAGAENMSDEELETLHKRYQERAQETLQSLEARRAAKKDTKKAA